MPITPHLDLTTRSEAGAPLSPTQFDTNYTAIEGKLNEVIDLISLIMLANGDLAGDAVSATEQLKDGIITAAKLKALAAANARKILRLAASVEEGAVAWQLESLPVPVPKRIVDSTMVASTGVQEGLLLSTFEFEELPAGDICIWVNVRARRADGANGGTVRLKQGATILATLPTHVVDFGTQWVAIADTALIAGFAGGDLTLTLEFETGEDTSSIEFGVGDDGRFGRSVMVLAGLNTA